MSDEMTASQDSARDDGGMKPPLPPKPPSSGFDASAGGDFVRFMEDRDIHPVLVFGTRASGKTTMLLSVLNYATGNNKSTLNAHMGENAFPPSIADAKTRYEHALEFMNVRLPAFSNNALPPATQTVEPFFIPLDVEAPGFGKRPLPCRLAFLEGLGEWYEMDEKTNNKTYKEIKPEITSIFKRFSKPISVIFVAPCYHPDGREELDYSHRCLANCINQYKLHRNDKNHDNILLLLSKWDFLHHPAKSEDFADPSVNTLLNDMKKFHFSWPAFSSLTGVGSKALMPYSAGWITEGTLNAPGSHQDTFDRYNRILLNWIFGNATQKIRDKGGVERPILYKDVAPPTTTLPNFIDRAIDIILG